MYLYLGTSRDLVSDAAHGRIAKKLKDAFFENFQKDPSSTTVRIWQGSLARLARVLEDNVLDDQGVVLEYQLPRSSKRVDCIITGLDHNGIPNAVIVELKEWSDVSTSGAEGVVVMSGARRSEVLHPSRQVANYQKYLESAIPLFGSGEVKLHGCTFLYKFPRRNDIPLFNSRLRSLWERHPVFVSDEAGLLGLFLKDRVGMGNGLDLARRLGDLSTTELFTAKEDLRGVGTGDRSIVLLDEQQVVYDEVLAKTKESIEGNEKAVFLIKGEPGSGKSILALKLIEDLSSRSYNVRHATASRIFSETIRRKFGPDRSLLLQHFNNYKGSASDRIDALIIDDIHRLSPFPQMGLTSNVARSGFSQARELIEAASTTVFFVDDRQILNPAALASAETINEAAAASGALFYQYELKGQFRFRGSSEYLNWIDNTLEVRKTDPVFWSRSSAFDFRIVSQPSELQSLIRARHDVGCLARMVAGLGWPWSYLKEDGRLRRDIVIGDWAMPWVPRLEDAEPPEGIPRATEWAIDPRGIDLVGNTYTVQGLEFDYVGVIFASDLRYDLANDLWVAEKSRSHDTVSTRTKIEFVEHLRNAYRLLLTRGSRGCYVCFTDPDTKRFFENRINGHQEMDHTLKS